MGRSMVSDPVLVKDLPKAVKESIEAHEGCLAGASFKKDYLNFIKEAGFDDIKIAGGTFYPVGAMSNDATVKVVRNSPGIIQDGLKGIEHSVASIKVSAVKRRR